MQIYMPIYNVLVKIASLILQENVTKQNNLILYCIGPNKLLNECLLCITSLFLPTIKVILEFENDQV